MRTKDLILLLIASCLLFPFTPAFSQLQVTESSNAQALAQKLVGNGVIISNAVVTQPTNAVPTGFFTNLGNTGINIDSGIVLTNGKSKSNFALNRFGVDGNGVNPAQSRLASTNLGLPGDADLSNAVGIPIAELHDAVILEFDVLPLGDTLTFRYCMSSEEYAPLYVCTYNDAFALLLSGPGITGQKNLAVVPGTNLPVTITNVNDVQGASCPNNPQYYVSSTTNPWLVHDGHTTVFTAKSDVQPCQTYHLKFVVADRTDLVWDSGVFIEAGSLNSDPVHIDSQTPLNESGAPYVAEGCHTSSIHLCRNAKRPYPQTVNLTFGGNAINGVDLQTISSSYVIPAYDSFVSVPVVPIADFIPEGIEHFWVYISSSGCGSSTYNFDSIDIEIRDINMLLVDPGDSAKACPHIGLQLFAEAGYTQYWWTGAGLNNSNIWNPVATPMNSITNYICTAMTGNCIASDSILVKLKTSSLVNKVDVLCHNGTNGQITVAAQNWDNSLEYAINNQPFQSSPVFSNLPVGNYVIKFRDSTCIDSMTVDIVQAFPDLQFTTITTAATCSISPDGTITVNASGGNGNYSYALDGGIYQLQNLFNVVGGYHLVSVKDANGCIDQHSVFVTDTNTININAGPDSLICEGTSITLAATSNASTYSWSPASTLNNATLLNPVATPTSNTMYILTALDGRCTKKDSTFISLRAAPVGNAGIDSTICIGGTIQLHGSGGISYQWSPATYFVTAANIKDPVVKPLTTTTYSLIVTDNFQCKSVIPAKVKISVTPTVKIFAGRDTVISFGQPVQLHAIELSGNNVTQYNWAPTTFLDNATISNPVATPNRDMVYTVTGITPAGCLATDDVVIKVYQGPEIYMPTAFTPNADGKNDVLHATIVGMKELHYLQIFNRWGQLVFSTQNSRAGWDGKSLGIEQPSGVYVWMAEAVDINGKKVFRKGTVTIIR